jgi:hypothetical protein
VSLRKLCAADTHATDTEHAYNQLAPKLLHEVEANVATMLELSEHQLRISSVKADVEEEEDRTSAIQVP